MKKPGTMQVKVGGVTLTVPVCGDEETTEAIVARVEARLSEIEEKSTRIDSQAFALAAAMSFASDLHKATTARESDTEQFSDALEGLTEALEALLEDFQHSS